MKRLAIALLGAGMLFAGSWNANAAVIDLTTANSTGTDAYNGSNVVFSQTAVQPAGTGIFGTFVQFESAGNATTEQGYNTTVNDVFDNKSADKFNHEITVSQIGFITVGGNQYMRFSLDINEQGNVRNSGLTIDELQLFISTNPNQSVETFDGAGLVAFNAATLVYRLDSGSNDSILLNAALNPPGSGVADMFMDVPIALYQSAFIAGGYTTPAAQNAVNIYLYTAASSVDAGFEEWAAITGSRIPGEVPEPVTISLIGLGLLAMAGIRRCRT